MSSIRLFILDAFERHGEIHGHQLRAYAEREHVSLWTDISVGSLYQALKRLVAEALLRSIRTEREGSFPERQILAITELGKKNLAILRREGLRDVIAKWDPFDLALTRAGPVSREAIEETIAQRLIDLRRALAERIDLNRNALPYLTDLEVQALTHREHILRSEIEWHESFIQNLPSIDLGRAANLEPK